MSGGESGCTVNVYREPEDGKSDDLRWKQALLAEATRVLPALPMPSLHETLDCVARPA